jgi:hypothetical protein
MPEDQKKEAPNATEKHILPKEIEAMGFVSFVEIHEPFITAISSAVLGLFTIALFGATVALYNSSEKVAEATRQSADISNRTLITTQRAFVFIDNIEFYIVGQEFRLLPKWVNSGTTPANPMTNWANWKTFTGEPPTDFSYPDLDATGQPISGGGKGIKFFIGPKGGTYAPTLNIPRHVMETIRSGEQRLFIWGWGDYKDVFEGSPLRRTEFCFEVFVKTLDSVNDKVTAAISFPLYGPHNSAN